MTTGKLDPTVQNLKECLQAMGVLNYGDDVSGEIEFLNMAFQDVESPLVLDVGANVGEYAQTVLNVCPSAKIFAFEPQPKSYEGLSKRAEVLNFNAVNAGCGNENKKMMLYDLADAEGSELASLFEGVITENHKRESVSREVDIIRLEDFLDGIGANGVYFVKIDTEGYEYEVLLGLGKYLTEKRIAIIQFEFNEMNVYSRRFFKDFYDLLSKDYSISRIKNGGLIPIKEYNPLLCELFTYQNIVCIKK
ncbi:MAG: FkbM family methyltransferase [Alphaproteobacteria bacterium]|nr:FkbM family methyltransferase [Alphaproteobacteria bacterium]